MVYRHGDRSADYTYPTDPYGESVWPQGFAQLTKLGMQEQYTLGAFVRRYYTGFLNETYVRYEIKVRASEKDRCLMSAEAHLSGLYPPHGNQIWNKEIKWQPIPVFTRPNITDNVVAQDEPCPRYDELYEEVLESAPVRKQELKNKPFYDFISKQTGLHDINVTNVWQIHDTLLCQGQHNLTAPLWVTASVYKKLTELEDWGFDLMYHVPEMKRIKGGPLLGQITEQMKAKVNGSLDSRMKLFMYSGHDTTVISFLRTLALWDGLQPFYTTMVIVELHATVENNEAFYVQIKYRNDTKAEPYLLTIPGCDSKCPFEQFLSLTKDMIPVDWHAECKSSQREQLPQKVVTSFSIGLCLLSVGTGLFVGSLATLLLMYLRKRKVESEGTSKNSVTWDYNYALLSENDDV